MADQFFGSISGVSENAFFKDRDALRAAGVHRHRISGIDGNPKEGASSIVLSGGYIDDQDLGDEIIYTGHGGNQDGKQVADQSWEATGNKALIVSELHGYPIRVTRGAKHKSPYSPLNGYKYGGLYRVVDHFEEIGKHGFVICRFRLEKINKDEIDIASGKDIDLPKGNKNTTKVKTTILRTVRDTVLSKSIKALYDYTCQVCGLKIEILNVGYAEAAHIKPLGKPHNGADVPGNILCLCPNHHLLFDKGAFSIGNDLSLMGIAGSLKMHKNHKIDLDNLRYHQEHIYISK